ncbi:MAG: transporter substrate-binding domain-containing protein [Bacteroidales bacterium]
MIHFSFNIHRILAANLSVVVLLLFFSCKEEASQPENRLEKIREAGKIVAVTDYNSTNYFIYRGEPMGYQYELLKRFADHLGLKLDIIANKDLQESFELLKKGEVDILAFNLTVTEDRRKQFDFTIPYTQTRQVLVQRKPDNWRSMSKHEIEKNVIRNQLELNGKVVYVRANSSYAQRLRNLNAEIGGGIKIIEKEDYSEEQLISLVARDEIDYTICDENIAKVNSTYYPDIDVGTAISFSQNVAWGVPKGADSLRAAANGWLFSFKNTLDYALIYNKYFRNQKSALIWSSDYYTLSSGKITPYDDIIQKYSKDIDWDWRLLASLMYQESRFNPQATSWAGASGLMQLMPSVIQRFNVEDKFSPEDNIRGGVEFIGWLQEQYEKRGLDDEEQRQKFVLAAYNVGLGHILDARRLAEKNGKDPDVWDNNVDEFILKKSDPEYYNDEVVYYGYARGSETYNYVRQILERYEHYINIVDEE